MALDGLDISPLKSSDYEDLLTFSLALFTESTKAEMESELKRIAQLDKYQTFIATTDDQAIGYATVTLRSDHVEGASTSPVGYLEAIYVDPAYRKQGVARALYEKGESWCMDRGCTEMGSDTWHWNAAAQDFHEHLGFRKEDILVHYFKKINP